jgi:hypothetical protein
MSPDSRTDGTATPPVGIAGLTGAAWKPAIAPPEQVRVVDPVATSWEAGVLLLRSLLPASDQELYSGDGPTQAHHTLDARVTYNTPSGLDVIVGFPEPIGAVGCDGVPARASSEACSFTVFADANVRLELSPAQLYAVISDPRWAWTMERGYVNQANRLIQNTFAENIPSGGTVLSAGASN